VLLAKAGYLASLHCPPLYVTNYKMLNRRSYNQKAAYVSQGLFGHIDKVKKVNQDYLLVA